MLSSSLFAHGDERSQTAYRALPYNVQAEQSLLGAVLANNGLLHRISDAFSGECFYQPVHAAIYETIQGLRSKGLIATPVTLRQFFHNHEGLAALGGASYLAELASTSVGMSDVESYASTVYELWLKRNLISLGESVVERAYKESLDSPASSQIEEAEKELFRLAESGQTQKAFVPLSESLGEALRRAELAHKRNGSLSGIDTGFDDLNYMLGGLHDSDLLILAGRPSMGKTAFAINLAINACRSMYGSDVREGIKTPRSVGFFSLEMSSEQLAGRMMSMESGVNSSQMRSGGMSEDDFLKIVDANHALYKLPFYIDDTPALTISAVRSRCRRLKRRHNLSFVVVDYLQLLRGTAKSSEFSRVQEVSEITQGLKALAKELNIPVLALSQLSRTVESRDDKRPQLSDLRESGSIEQDADAVMFIYRDQYYVERREPPEHETEKYKKWQQDMERCRNLSEILIAKHRHGPIGKVKLSFDANTTKFGTPDQEWMARLRGDDDGGE
ncbi:MAG: replicative DNA helicase [Rickettsiales bacterium]